MKDRGKGVAQLAFNAGDPFSLSEIIPCREHPRSSNVGICAYCLKDRLLKLICSECGEQRLSSCSCSDDLSSNRNSCAHDVASVGRVSFLLENEKQGTYQGGAERGPWNSLTADKSKEAVFLRRSSSSCVESRSSSSCVESRRSGIWRVGKLFHRKKKRSEKNSGGGNQGQRDRSKSELWVFDEVQMSRSRSRRSFRWGDNWNFSGARSSSVNRNPGPVDSDRKSCFSEAEMRRSGFSDTEIRKSCFSETDARKSVVLEGGVETCNPDIPRLNRRIFSLRDSDYFGGMDERNFIDLSFCSAAESKAEDWPRKGPIGEGSELRSGSCRVTARDKLGMKKSRSFMGWRWGLFRHHRQPQTSTVNSNCDV